MTSERRNRFDQEHLKRWLATTRYYLFSDMDTLPGTSARVEDDWPPAQTDSNSGRNRLIARVRDRLLRPSKREGQGDPLRELGDIFHQQITFIARHPDVPRRLLVWLAQDSDRALQRRVRMLIGNFATRQARIIGRARQQGLIRADIEPYAAAMGLVGVTQQLVLETCITPQPMESFLRKASVAFACYLAALGAGGECLQTRCLAS